MENNYILSERIKEISKLEPTIRDNSVERLKLRLEIAEKILNNGSFNKKTKELGNPVFLIGELIL